MELGGMLKTLINSIQSIMINFTFTIGGVTVDLWSFFLWCLFAGFLFSVLRRFLE